MNVTAQAPWLLGLLLATTRIAAFIVVAPPFAGRAIPAPVKGALAIGIALPVAGHIAPPEPAVATLVVALLGQVVAGLALGFLVLIAFSAVQAAGDLIDLFGGFTLAAAYDPLSLNSSGPVGRLQNLIATTLLVATGGHLLLLDGLVSSFDGLPLDGTRVLGGTLVAALSQFLVAALQLAAPVLAVLFVTEVALGLIARAAPALNVLQLGFPVKIGITLLTLGVALPLIPSTVSHVVSQALGAMHHLVP